MRKLTTVILLVCFCISLLSGCTTEKDKSETVNLIWYCMGDVPKDMDKVMAKVNEYTKAKINCTVELRLLDWGEIYETKLKKATLAGEPWDICFTGSWLLNYSNYARQGYFAPMNELLAKYGQGISKVTGKMPQYLDSVRVNGEVYAIPVIGCGGYWEGYYFAKSDIDKYKFDLSKVKQLEDLYPLFDKSLADNPNRICITNYWWLDDRDKFDFLIEYNFPGAVRIDDKNCRVVNQYEDADHLKTLKKLRQLYLKGYTKKDPQVGLTAGSNPLSQVDTYTYYSNQERGLDTADQHEIVSVPAFPRPIVKSIGIAQDAMMAISAQSKHSEKAMEFLNLLYTDPVLENLLMYGIEDVHYKKVAANKIKILNSDYKQTAWLFGFPYSRYALEGYPDDWNTAPLKYEEDNAITSPVFGFAPNIETVSSEIAALKNVVDEFAPNLKYGMSDPDVVLPQFNKRLKAAGLDKFIAEMQRQVDEWKKKYNK